MNGFYYEGMGKPICQQKGTSWSAAHFKLEPIHQIHFCLHTRDLHKHTTLYGTIDHEINLDVNLEKLIN